MRIVICVKHVLDPEMPARLFRIDESGRRPTVAGMRPMYVPDSYAEHALELGIQLRDRIPGSTATALCVGDSTSDDVLRRAYALTADAAVRAWDPSWLDLDALATSHIVARAIAAIGGADLVLCGRQASDIEESVFGPALAEELGVPCVTSAIRVAPSESGIVVEREADGMMLTVESPLPAVVTVTSAPTNVPRMAKVKDAMMAKRKPIRVFDAAALSLDAERSTPSVRIDRLSLATVNDRCEMIDGVGVREQAAALAGRLRELSLI
jgi:electron transfer flavoprotein beta subunit